MNIKRGILTGIAAAVMASGAYGTVRGNVNVFNSLTAADRCEERATADQACTISDTKALAKRANGESQAGSGLVCLFGGAYLWSIRKDWV